MCIILLHVILLPTDIREGEKQVAVFLVDEGIKKAPEVPGLFCVLGVYI